MSRNGKYTETSWLCFEYKGNKAVIIFLRLIWDVNSMDNFFLYVYTSLQEALKMVLIRAIAFVVLEILLAEILTQNLSLPTTADISKIKKSVEWEVTLILTIVCDSVTRFAQMLLVLLKI